MEKTYLKFIKDIKSKDFIKKVIILIFCIFIMAINYNVILLQNNIVVGGVSGIALIIKKYIEPSVFIMGANIFFSIIAFFFLSREQFRNGIIGSILFPIMISITEPLTEHLVSYFMFDNIIITLIISALLFGFSNGYVYKCGFSTGGGDIAMELLAKYCHIQTGKASFFVNGAVLLLGAYVLGANAMIYGIIILYIGSLLIDRIMIGISDSKQFLIYSKKTEKIKDFIIGELNCGVTLLEAKGGYLKEKKEVIMCVVANKDYVFFKSVLLKVDPDVFFVISDCYEVSGGVKSSNLPFI